MVRILTTFPWVSMRNLALISLLATASTVMGITPNITARPSHILTTAAYAQNPPNSDEVAKYAKAVLAMEPHRRAAAQEIRNAGGNPNIVCSSVFSGLPGGNIAQEYCSRAARIVESYGLTNRRFNEITRLAQGNAQVRGQIRSQMEQLCRQPEFSDACRR